MTWIKRASTGERGRERERERERGEEREREMLRQRYVSDKLEE